MGTKLAISTVTLGTCPQCPQCKCNLCQQVQAHIYLVKYFIMYRMDCVSIDIHGSQVIDPPILSIRLARGNESNV